MAAEPYQQTIRGFRRRSPNSKNSEKATPLGECDEETVAQRTIGLKEIEMRKVLITGANEHGFQVYPKEPPPSEFIDLLHAHEDRLRALMDKPVVLCVHWEDGDKEASVTIMPVDGRPDDLFKKFMLPFPNTGRTGHLPAN
jgi:hypothetical protein